MLQILDSSCTSRLSLSGSKRFLLETARVFSISARPGLARGLAAKPPPPAAPLFSRSSPRWFCSPRAEPAQALLLGRAIPAVQLPEPRVRDPEPGWLCTWPALVCRMLSGVSCSSLQDNSAEAERDGGGGRTSGVGGAAHLVHSVLPSSCCHVPLWMLAWGSMHSTED